MRCMCQVRSVTNVTWPGSRGAASCSAANVSSGAESDGLCAVPSDVRGEWELVLSEDIITGTR